MIRRIFMNNNGFVFRIRNLCKVIVVNSDILSAIRRKIRYIKSEIELSKAKKAYDESGFSMNIKRLKNTHFGERCFIIGNGPSLSPNDLDKLKNEYTFASNRIFLMYGKTDWRPTYYLCQDRQMLRSCTDYYGNCKEKVILGFQALRDYNISVPGADYFLQDSRFVEKSASEIPFSEDVSERVYDGCSITYTAIQIAVYMGFKEIYLLGVDHSYSKTLDKNLRIIDNDTVKKDYFDNTYQDVFKQYEKMGKTFGAAPIITISNAYKSAKQYCDQNNIIIRNVTRGGKLEIFERENLDCLIV